ncbi:MAG TPA: zinc ribbon domain-containing protein [Candidatus Binatia bacterium]
MPIYEYHCGKCGDFEVMQKMSDKPLSTCPTCKRKVQKLISSTSFQLKGSGWYVTDYARKGGSGSGGSEKSSKSESKSESKKDDSGDGASSKAGDAAGGKASGDSAGSGTKKAGKSSEKAAAA